MVKMKQKDLERGVRYVLRYALEHNGAAGYNPCMYHLGFADNIPPSEDFNNELRKYGSLRYDDMDDGYYSYAHIYGTWSYFQIDERGKKYMDEIEPSIFFKIIRMILTIVLSIIQIVFVIEGWISYILNSIIKLLSVIFFPIALISFLWWPLDMLCGICWMTCDWLKRIMWDKGFKWEASSRRWLNHFPEL